LETLNFTRNHWLQIRQSRNPGSGLLFVGGLCYAFYDGMTDGMLVLRMVKIRNKRLFAADFLWHMGVVPGAYDEQD
jgi:hypothetical protein